MEENKLIGQENEKLNTAILEGIHYKYEYHPLYKCKVIEFEIDDNCDQRVFDFIQSLYQSSKGSYFQFDAIQNEEQRKIIELLLANKPPINSNRPISSEIEIHQAMFSVKIKSKKNTLTDAQKIELIRYWKVPTLPNHFIGRQQLLEELTQRLDPKKVEIPAVVITACYGLGGIGKTFLAAQYAQTQRGNYTFILWFNAENNETLYRDYYDFATAIQLPIEKQSPENVIAMVKTWLENHPTWLIVYDNAPDDKLITKYRPAKGGKVLITSRKESWSEEESLSIDVFSVEEARAYIIKLTNFKLSEHQEKIDKLAKTLGNLPLALAQACAYIKARKISLEKYLVLYAENKAAMLAKPFMPPESNYKFSVAITWNITFKAIEEEQPTAISLLESCVFLQGNTIPEFLLEHIFNKQQPTLADQLEPFIDALGCLQQYSMLKNINDVQKVKTFSMHNLVQEVIADALSNEKKQAYLLNVIQSLQESFPVNEIEQLEDYAKQRSLLPHLEKGMQRINELLDKLKENQILSSTVKIKFLLPMLELSAHGYTNLGNTSQAKQFLEDALAIKKVNFDEDHFQVARTLGNLANAYGDLGDAKHQLQLSKRALKIFERCDNKLEIARAKMNFAIADAKLGNAQQAKKLLENVLPVFKGYYGENHCEVASLLGNFAGVLQNLGNNQLAKEYYESALLIFEQHYCKSHPQVAITLTNLANVFFNLQKVQQAKELLERALQIQQELYGEDYPVVGMTLTSLALAIKKLGKEDDARQLFERALQILEQHYGKDHHEVAITLINLADIYKILGNFPQSIELLKRALDIQTQYYGQDHPEVAATINNLASAHVSLDEWSTAKLMAERAYRIFSTHPNAGPQHPYTQAAGKNLDLINERLASFAKALRNAANQNNVEKLKELLSQGVDVNVKDDGQHGRTALHWAVIKQAYPCIKLLLTTGADAMLVDKAGKSSLDYAGENSIPGALFLLLNHHYKLPLEDIDVGKLLRRAAHQNKVNDIKLLLKHIKNINEKDTGNTQRTALHWALIQGATDCIEVLLMAGADPHLADGQSKTAYDYAQDKPELLSLLPPITTQTYIL